MGVTKDADDEIVITGMSGRYPESDNLEELWDNLMNKRDMIKVDDRRWPVGVFEVDTFGKLKDISRFDAPFFNFTPEQANQCAPDIRIMLEVAWETLADSGYNPLELENTPTGIYIGNCIIEAGEALTNNVKEITATGLLNSMHSSLPNKISQYFKFTGPSETHDTGCSASLIALDTAVMAMKRGEITSALVGGCSLNLKPQATVALHRMNMVSKRRGCRVYDESADGYSRAECISLVFLQWKSAARRVYGRIVNTVTNNDGFKEQGIIFPSSKSQVSLLKEAYDGTCVSEADVKYIEAHGTGTQAGDTQECLAVDSFFCRNRTQDNPILLGSIKSNLGHAEPASGVASLCKILLSYVNNVIPPNIHLNKVNPKLEAVIQGRLKIVTEPTSLKGNALVSLNAFGFGGSNAHVILLPNENASVEEDEGAVYFVCGRTEVGVEEMLNLAAAHSSRGLQDLLRGLSTIPRELCPVRGYQVISPDQTVVDKHLDIIPDTRNQVWLLIGGLGSQWVGMARDLMRFATFRKSLERCNTVLKNLGSELNLTYILCHEDSDIERNVVSMFVGLSALIIALTDILRTVGVVVDGVIGHSLGDTLCGYPLRIHTVEDVMTSAYVRSTLFLKHPELQGWMHAVNIGPAALTLPDNLTIGCYNSSSHVTLTSTSRHTDFFSSLVDKNIKVREVASGGYAFHSPVFSHVRDEVMREMEFVGYKEKPVNWISTSYPASSQPEIVNSALFCDNLVNPVYFSDNVAMIPPKSTVIELSGNSSLLGLLGADYQKVGLLRYKKNCEETLLAGLGKLFVGGLTSDPYKILPAPSYPVPRATAVLSSAVAKGWDHGEKWWVPEIHDFLISTNESKMNKFVSTYEIGKPDSNCFLDTFLEKYQIMGRPILPLSVGVYLAWQAFARVNDVTHSNLSVQMHHVLIHNNIDLAAISLPVSVSASIMPKSGKFQITVGDVFFMSGTIETYDQLLECVAEFNTQCTGNSTAEELFSFYQLQSSANRLISKVDMEDFSCKLQTSESLLEILDCHFQLLQLEQHAVSPLVYIKGASSIVLDARGFYDADWISKPYQGSCKSDAVFVDNAWFDILQPNIPDIRKWAPLINGQNRVISEQNRLEYHTLLYTNLIGAHVDIGKEKFIITTVQCAMEGQLHVCYATDITETAFAVGLLNKEEVLDTTNIIPGCHFFKVRQDVFNFTPEYWASVSVCLCLVFLLELGKTQKLIVIGDGNLLYEIFKEIVQQRFSKLDTFFINVKTTPLKDAFNSEVTDCAINLSSSKHVVDALALTNRCGKTINLLQTNIPDDCGMSSLLKNISVINFKAGYIKFSMYWDTLRSKMYQWAKDFPLKGSKVIRDRVPLKSLLILPGTTELRITVHSPTDYIDKIFSDYFHHKHNYKLTTHRHTYQHLICIFLMSGSQMMLDEKSAENEDHVYDVHFSPVQIKLCLNDICSNSAVLDHEVRSNNILFVTLKNKEYDIQSQASTLP